MRRTPYSTNKILICIPFWAGDMRQAIKLARLLTDLEDRHSELADVLFVARFDCPHDDETVKYVSRRFNVFTHTSKRRETGWPMGCNGTFFGSMEWVYHKMSSGKVPNYKAVLNLGADSCPLRRDWLSTLSHAWDLTNAHRKTYVAGPFLKDASGGGHDHINGDAIMLSGDLKFMKWLAVTVGGIKAAVGWDWGLAGDFRKWGWENFPFIKSLWQKPNMTHEEWDSEFRQGTILIHGVKSDDLLDISRKNLV
jgi:hypothetical protein